MARLYSNENFPLPVVEELRRLGHDVVTTLDAGNANRSIPDEEVLRFAAHGQYVLLTLNRKHFVRLHEQGSVNHPGIVVCSFDRDFVRQAQRIHQLLVDEGDLSSQLFRINRPAQ